MSDRAAAPGPVTRKACRAEWIMGAVPSLLMCQSVGMKLAQSAGVAEHFAQLGWGAGLMQILAFLELACTLLYLLPRTAALGAVLLAGYPGGAVAAHLRVDEGAVALFRWLLGGLLWGGLWLRDPR